MARGRKKDQDEAPASPKKGRKSRARKSPNTGLFPDEAIVMTAVPARAPTLHKYLMTLGLYGLWRKRRTSTVTDSRVLMGRGIVHRTERSIPMRHIEDVVFKRQGLNGWVEVAVNDRGNHKSEQIGPMSPRMARRFANEVLRRI